MIVTRKHIWVFLPIVTLSISTLAQDSLKSGSDSIIDLAGSPGIEVCANARKSGYPTPLESVERFRSHLRDNSDLAVVCRAHVKNSLHLRERDFTLPYRVCGQTNDAAIRVKSAGDLIDIRNLDDVIAARNEIKHSIYKSRSKLNIHVRCTFRR